MWTRIPRGVVLRKIKGVLGGCFLNSQSFTPYAVQTQTSSIAGMIGLCCLALLMAVLLFTALHSGNHATAFGMAGLSGVLGNTKTETVKKPAKIREMEANLKAIAKELETGQMEMAAGPISQERGDELEEKAKEMEELQSHLDRYNRVAGVVKASRELKDVTLPGTENVSRKRLYTTPGHLFVSSQGFKSFQARQQGWSEKVDAGARMGKRVLLTGQDAADFEAKAFDPANLPTLGADSIIPFDRDPELVRFAEPEILTIRDMLNVVPTTSDAVKYVKYTTTQRGAASQATRGALKGFLKLQTDLVSTNVETIAVLSKVTEQDIDDAPRLVGLINGEMTLDVKVEEERQLAWGDGNNGNLKGLFHADNALPEFNRASVGDTLIDTIRKMRTDLRKARVTPNFVAIDPLDWESVELAKGTTNYYIWGLVSDMRGPRVWSLQVIESDGMTNLETGERRLLMGDGPRGATIYDRAGIQLAVGFMDDDFGRNLRTMRCEERLALAVKRNFAFEFLVTEEAAS